GSGGLHAHEQLNWLSSGFAVAMAFRMPGSSRVCPARAPLPMYIVSFDRPGAMLIDCVMSRVCSVSSQKPPAELSTQLTFWPSTDRSVIGTVLVWCALVK